MRTRWMLVAAILILASIPGTIGLAEEAGCNPATAVAAVPSVAANAPAPTALPDWANLPTQTPAPQTPQGVDKPTFLINNCSNCTASPRCRTLHSCVLLGCC